MSISSTTNRISYTGTGLVSTYSYTFRIFDETHLLVTTRTNAGVVATLVLNTDYTVTGVGDATGGTIVLSAALADETDITIRRVLPLTQPTDIRNQGSFFPETHENALDRGIMIGQQLQDELNRTPRIPESESEIGDLPSVDDRASRFLAFDSSGDPIASSGGISSDIPVSAFMETLLDDVDAAAARTTLGVIFADVDNVTLQQSGGIASIKNSGVTTVKIADSNVTTAKIADSNVTTAKIADSNVTTAKIADANVTTAKLAASLGIQTLDVTTLLKLKGFTASTILQMVLASTSTEFNTTSGTFTATGLKVDITPKLSTSSILIIAAGTSRQGVGADGWLTIARGGASLGGSNGFHSQASNNNYHVCMFYVDTPGVTTSTRYEVYSRSGGGTQIFFPAGSASGVPQAVILAIEIAS